MSKTRRRTTVGTLHLTLRCILEILGLQYATCNAPRHDSIDLAVTASVERRGIYKTNMSGRGSVHLSMLKSWGVTFWANWNCCDLGCPGDDFAEYPGNESGKVYSTLDGTLP